jgi:hypothetical protein
MAMIAQLEIETVDETRDTVFLDADQKSAAANEFEANLSSPARREFADDCAPVRSTITELYSEATGQRLKQIDFVTAEVTTLRTTDLHWHWRRVVDSDEQLISVR